MDISNTRYYNSNDMKVHASSPPYCIMRNRSSYQLKTTSHDVNVSMSLLRQQCWQQANYYHDFIGDQEIPTYLLYNALKEDKIHEIKEMKHFTMNNSLTRCYHGNKTLLIHSSGYNLDSLTIRDVSYLKPYNKYREYGFTVNVSNGGRLKDITMIESSIWNNSSHILTRTSSDIYHLKTNDVINDLRSAKKRSYSIILEPVQKWSLLNEIIALKSSQSTWSQSYIITTNGDLYTLSPNHGIHKENSNNTPIIPTQYFDVKNGVYYNNNANIYTSHHPQIIYISCNGVMMMKDLRSSSIAHPIFSYSSDCRISDALCYPSIPSYTYNENYMFITASYKDTSNTTRHLSSIIDIRQASPYPESPNTINKSLSTRYLPEAHQSLKSISLNEVSAGYNNYSESINTSTGILTLSLTFMIQTINLHDSGLIIGASAKSRQIYLHSLDNRGLTIENDSKMNGSEAIRDSQCLNMLLGATTTAGINLVSQLYMV